MALRKYQFEGEACKRNDKRVRVARSYYTFSKYYPAGDSNHVYRKSISRAQQEKRNKKIIGICSAGVAVLGLVLLYLL